MSCLSGKAIAIIDGREGRKEGVRVWRILMELLPSSKDWTGLWAIDQIQSHAALWMGTRARTRMPDTGNYLLA